MRRAAARATLLAVALSYGSQDVALRLVLTMAAAPPPPAVALVKALIQAAAFAPPYFLSRQDGNAPPWSVSLGLAASLVAANEFLLAGLKRTSAAKAAFLLQLSVVFTPVLEYVVLRRRKSLRVWLGALLACVGCAFLTGGSDASFAIVEQRTGDLLVVAAATAWAAYIVLTAAIPPDAGALEVQARKNVCAAGFYGACWASAAAVEPSSGAWTPLALGLIAYCALVPGAVADVLQQHAQSAIHAAEAVVMMASEPIWAALFAAPALGEELTRRVAGGGAIIFVGAALAVSGSEDEGVVGEGAALRGVDPGV